MSQNEWFGSPLSKAVLLAARSLSQTVTYKSTAVRHVQSEKKRGKSAGGAEKKVYVYIVPIHWI